MDVLVGIKLFMKKFLFVLLFILIGCRDIVLPANHYTVYVDPAFMTYTDKVINNIQQWSDTATEYDTPMYFTFILKKKDCFKECVAGEFSISPIEPVPLLQLASQFADPADIIGIAIRNLDDDHCSAYVLDDLSSDTERATTVKHEAGHCLGLHHTGPGTIMFPIFGKDQAKDVSCVDIQQLAKIRNEIIPTCPN